MDDENRFELRVEISIQDWRQGGAGLRISENVRIPVGTFLEMAQVLGEFHKVIEALKAADVG